MESRRSFIGKVGAVAASAAILAVAKPSKANSSYRGRFAALGMSKVYGVIPTGSKVYLNDVDMTTSGFHCDTEEGWIEHFCDKDGNPVHPCQNPPQEWPTRRTYGKVEVR